MGLRLNTPPAARGWHWIRQALAVWRQKPLAFIGLFTSFMLAVLLMAMLPLVGGLLSMALLPMLTLGYMVATRGALAGEPVHPLQLVEGLRHPDPARRRAQWQLGLALMTGTVAVVGLAHVVDGGLFEAFQQQLAEQQGQRTAATDAILDDPRFVQGMVLRVGGLALLSLPFWYAPALVHWGGQGPAQALFSSLLGLWQARAAYVVFLLGWVGLFLAGVMVVGVITTLTGLPQLAIALAVALGLILPTVFYMSLWFSYTDTYQMDDAGPDDAAVSAPAA